MSEPDEDLASDGEEVAGSRKVQLRRALQPPIQSLCSALGGYEDVLTADGSTETGPDGTALRVYVVGDECLSCLKDLKRFWRMDDDDEDRTVARILAETNVLANDLIPIFQVSLGTSTRGNKIALACADLIAAMTWPIDVVEELREAELQDDTQHQEKIDYSSLLAAHLAYKAAILRSGMMKQLFHLLVPALKKDRRSRTERDQNIISLILHVVRNLAAIKDRPASVQSSAHALELSTLQSELVVQLQSGHFLGLLLTIASGAEKSEWNPWNMITLDILHLLFRGVLPPDVANALSTGKAQTEALHSLLSAEDRLVKAEKRKVASRHSRFGTTLTLTAGNRKYAMHQQSAINLSPSKIIDSIKKGKAKPTRTENDLAPPGRLRADALVVLRTFACSFIRNSLNAFFLSVLKDIRLERPKTKESDNTRALVLSAFFLDLFLLLQKQDKADGVDQTSEEWHGFPYISGLIDQQSISYAMARMREALGETPVRHVELHASIECLVQMLLSVDAMSLSAIEGEQEIGMTLQNKIYYDAQFLDNVLKVLSDYKGQSRRYLDSVIHLTYVLMRMLEKYSKNTDAIFVRKKRKAKRTGGGDGDDDEQPKMTFAEHAFHFEDYEERLAGANTLSTLMTYLDGYRTFQNEEHCKRLVSIMHRIAVRAKADCIFYKPSVLDLFNRILNDKKVLPRQQPYQDLTRLIEYILKRFFKAAQERPILLLEIFFPLRKSEMKRMMRGENLGHASGHESDGAEPTLKLAAELEFKVIPELTDTKKMGIAIAVISDNNKEYLLDWVKDNLRIAAAQRQEIMLNTDGLPDADIPLDENGEEDADAIRQRRLPVKPSEEAVAQFQPYEVPYPDNDMVRAGTRDNHLKLLLRLLQWESVETADRLSWTIPTSRMPDELAADVRIIDGFLINPLDPENGKSAADLLRRKQKPRTRRDRGVDAEGNADALSDEDSGHGKAQKGSQRRQKRIEERKSYKSAQFIEDSDDEDLDAFYAKEAILRQRNNEHAGKTLEMSQPTGVKQTKGKKATKRRKRQVDEVDEGLGPQAASNEHSRIKPRPARRRATTSPSSPGSDSLAKASTPPSSLAHSSPSATSKSRLSPPPAALALHDEDMASSNDETDIAVDDLPPSSGRFARKEARVAKRARAVIADSDDD